MGNFWLLTLKDGEEIRIKPDAVDSIKLKMGQGGHIITKDRTIAVSDIKRFEVTDIPYSDKLLGPGENEASLAEDAARAFDEPVLNPDGSVVCRWVKKKVPIRKWTSYYQALASYHLLEEDSGWVTMAWFSPVHSIDYSTTQDCTEVEHQMLEKKYRFR